MKASIPLGRWFGVPVGLHYSWFILAWLIALSLTAQFASINPAWSTGMVWGLSVVTAALFFVSIVLHELAHSTVARMSGVPVRGITLFALGGVSQIEKEASSPARNSGSRLSGRSPVSSSAPRAAGARRQPDSARIPQRRPPLRRFLAGSPTSTSRSACSI
ncbi:MAG: site-2 protease family protein [Vicinamibacterales bacterium]